MAAISLHAETGHSRRARSLRLLDVPSDNRFSRARHPATDVGAVLQPFDPPRLLCGNAAERVQPETPASTNGQVIEKHVAIQEGHNRMANLMDDPPRILAAEQSLAHTRQEPVLVPAAAQLHLAAPPFGYAAPHGQTRRPAPELDAALS